MALPLLSAVRLGLIILAPVLSAVAPALCVPPVKHNPPAPRLLSRATKVADVSGWTRENYNSTFRPYNWLTDRTVLFFRGEPHTDSGYRCYLYDMSSHKQRYLRAVTRMMTGSPPVTVSPDGQWIFWAVVSRGVQAGPLHNAKSSAVQQLEPRCYYYWMGNDRLLEFSFRPTTPKPWVARVRDRVTGRAISTRTLSTQTPPGDEAAWGGRVLTSQDQWLYPPDTRHYWNSASVPVCVTSIWNDGRKPQVFTVMLPVHRSLVECVVAPRGDRIAWVLEISPSSPQNLAGRELGLWVSDINGRNMHLIGTVFEKAVPYDNHQGFEYVSWSPGENILGFLFQLALWTVPAN